MKRFFKFLKEKIKNKKKRTSYYLFLSQLEELKNFAQKNSGQIVATFETDNIKYSYSTKSKRNKKEE